MQETIAAEIFGLADSYRSTGLAGIVDAIDQRSYQPGASLYLITDVSGRILAGNVSRVPANLLDSSGAAPITVPYERYSGDDDNHVAMVQVVRLPGGFRLLVGRDISERERFRDIIARALAWSLALTIGLALLSWFFVSRRVLKRIDSLSAASRRIMVSDLSGRLEVTGSGDEFDRLAESLNAMLDRIERLLTGLKNVSDNIAHDLKTPLTRLRNGVEAALAGPADPEAYRSAMEATIEESDQLIKTFNALLMIARMEAGSQDESNERSRDWRCGARRRRIVRAGRGREGGSALDRHSGTGDPQRESRIAWSGARQSDRQRPQIRLAVSGCCRSVADRHLGPASESRSRAVPSPITAQASRRPTANGSCNASSGSKKAVRSPVTASVSVWWRRWPPCITVRRRTRRW